MTPDNQDVLHSLLLCERHRDKDDAPKVWRVSDFLGYGGSTENPNPVLSPDRADILVLDDANPSFRDTRESWPAAIKNLGEIRWILYKAARPLSNGLLWDELQPHLSRTVAVVNIDDLRAGGVLISQGISWERTCAELAWALRSNPCLLSLSQCAAVVVLFPYAGAFVYENAWLRRPGDEGPWCSITFDPTHLEGQTEHPIGKSLFVFAGGTCRTFADFFSIGLAQEVNQAELEGFGPDGARFPEESSKLTGAFEDTAKAIKDLSEGFYLFSYCSPKRKGSHKLKVTWGGSTGEAFGAFSAAGFTGGCTPLRPDAGISEAGADGAVGDAAMEAGLADLAGDQLVDQAADQAADQAVDVGAGPDSGPG